MKALVITLDFLPDAPKVLCPMIVLRESNVKWKSAGKTLGITLPKQHWTSFLANLRKEGKFILLKSRTQAVNTKSSMVNDED